MAGNLPVSAVLCATQLSLLAFHQALPGGDPPPQAPSPDSRSSAEMIGKRNASVLPDPVPALTTTFRPASALWSACC